MYSVSVEGAVRRHKRFKPAQPGQEFNYEICEGSGKPSLFQKARSFAYHVRERARERGLPDDWVMDLDKP
jgi:hypothetical protein